MPLSFFLKTQYQNTLVLGLAMVCLGLIFFFAFGFCLNLSFKLS
jgi:hypothetical protein